MAERWRRQFVIQLSEAENLAFVVGVSQPGPYQVHVTTPAPYAYLSPSEARQLGVALLQAAEDTEAMREDKWTL